MPASRRFPLLLIGAFLALYLVWGSTYLFIRIGVESWPPMLMAGVRFLIAGGLLYGFLRWRGVPAPTWPCSPMSLDHSVVPSRSQQTSR